ncbi:MAG: phage tail tape measure protein [Rhodobacteraceae bacterium]|nr:phage tail tape measure protein [Paracoccaceae bacterium]
MTDFEDIEEFDERVVELGGTLSATAELAAAFDVEMQRMRNSLAVTGLSMSDMEKAMTGGLRKAIDGVVLDGMRLSEALTVVANSMVNTAYRSAVDPVVEHLGGMFAGTMSNLFGGLGLFANGAGFSQGRVMPFASGGVISAATAFPMRGGLGVMGEAGPEAIMPLSRGANGKLGVRAEGGGRPVTVVMNITTPDVQGFRRSQSQVAAQMSRALSLGRRNL